MGGAAYRQPLCIILLVVGEERLERVVTGDNEAGKVGQELAAEVEDDKEEVEGADTNDSISLGDTGLLLSVVEERVLGELSRWHYCQRLVHSCRCVMSQSSSRAEPTSRSS